MNFAASPVLELTLPVWRSRFLMCIFVAGFALLLGRAVYLQGLANDFLQAKGESRYSRVMEVPANRGRILDRNGEALAISTQIGRARCREREESARAEHTEVVNKRSGT